MKKANEINEYMGKNVRPSSMSVQEIIVKGNNYKKNFLGRTMLSVSIPLVKSELSEWWHKKGNTTSFALGGSIMLSPEFRWGSNSRFFSRLYGMVDYQIDVHNLINNHGALVIGPDYVDTPLENFYPIISEKGESSLRLKTLSVGSYFRTMIYPGFFFDIGGGYSVLQSGILHFKEGSSDKPIKHLSSDGVLKESKFRGVLKTTSEQNNRLFGLVTLGFAGKKPRFGYPPGGFYYLLQGRIYRRDITPSNSNQLLVFKSVNQNTQEFEFEKLPLTDDLNKWRFAFHVGLGLTF